MKLTCLPLHLSAGLAAVSRVVPTRSTLPVLGNVLLSAEDGCLTLTGTNLELTVRADVPAAVGEAGAITLPARLLSDYVGLLTASEPLSLELRGTKAHLTCGRSVANLSGIDAEEFPALPSVEGMSGFAVPCALLKQMIGQTALAAAPDHSRPVLAGVLVAVKDGWLTLAAADGFRLAIRRSDLDDEAPDLSVIVPAKALTEAARSLPAEGTADVLVTDDRTQVAIRHAGGLLISRLIEGQFPDFERIIPRESKTRTTINTADLLRAVKAAQVFARDNSMIVRLNFQTDESIGEPTGRVTVSATASEIGAADGQVDAAVEGDAMLVAFNGRYLRDALDSVDTADVSLETSGPDKPGLIRPCDAGADYLHVVMPMAVNR